MQERDQSNTLIRIATVQDIPGMLEIFNYYLENSFAAYLETPIGPEIFQISDDENESDKSKSFPFYVMEENNRVIGIGALKPYLPFRNFQHIGNIFVLYTTRIYKKRPGNKVTGYSMSGREKKEY